MRPDRSPLLELLETLRPKLDPEIYAACHIFLSRVEFQTQQIACLIEDLQTKVLPTLRIHDEWLTIIQETAEIKEVLP